MSDAKKLQESLLDLCAYIASSAVGLREEPRDYAPARLLEILSRLAKIMDREYGDPFLQALSKEIDEDAVNLLVTDKEKFYALIGSVVLRLAKEIKKRCNA